jgi:hypothetical protein
MKHVAISMYIKSEVFDRKLTTNFCKFIGRNLVTQKSKKQNIVARSSAKAEYRAMASTTN